MIRKFNTHRTYNLHVDDVDNLEYELEHQGRTCRIIPCKDESNEMHLWFKGKVLEVYIKKTTDADDEMCEVIDWRNN